ncbi:MAG: hypothetical protein V4510_08580 [bacterium]
MPRVVMAIAILVLAGCTAPANVATSGTSTQPSTSLAQTTAPPVDPLMPPPAANATTPGPGREVTWHLGASGDWIPSGTPPPCPDPLVLATPVDLGVATAILYPGQVRGNAFKLHGGFRFDNNTDNNVTVRLPFDAYVVRGTHAMRNGTDIGAPYGLEEQDGFEFIAPCGIMYTFGHLRRLSPEFRAIADALPLIIGFNKTQYYDVDPPVHVHAGDLLATAVGFEANLNVFVDFGVLDLRHTNGKTLRPEWSQYSDGFDTHAVCWLDWFGPTDSAKARDLPGGSQESGKQSDYC